MAEILNVDYKDFYRNKKKKKQVPDKESKEYIPFFEFQKRIINDGCFIEGEYFTPFLTWHLNLWNTEVDQIEGGDVYMFPDLRDNEWKIANAIHQAETYTNPETGQLQRKGLIILGCRRLAKDLLNSSLLYKEDKTITIGESKIGDKIYDDNGELTTITGVYPQGKRPVYKITLLDGRELFCGLDHNWEIIEKGNKKFKGKQYGYEKTSIKTTKELIDDGFKRERIHNGYKDKTTRKLFETKYSIRNSKAVKYSEKDLSIDPYFLGLWLGDGSSRTPSITTMDQEIVDYLYKYSNYLNLNIIEEIYRKTSKAKNYHLINKEKGCKNYLSRQLKAKNLILNKHIPKEYLYSSIEQRLALLQGLMDTDGGTLKGGSLTFSSSNERLANDFENLCRSLGITLKRVIKIPKYKYKGIKKEGKPSHFFSLYTDQLIFRLTRKLNNIQNRKGFKSKIKKTSIVNIEYVFDDFTTCITVDNKQSLFLTDGYTITHNSVIAASYLASGATLDINSQNVLAGVNSKDIKLITNKLDKGLNALPDYFQWQRIEDNWRDEVILGVKEKGGKRHPFSYITIRNLDNGNNQEAIAGTKPRKLIIDEIGKSSWIDGFNAAQPGFTTRWGWGCSPILTGTGGDMDNFLDAKTAFTDPAKYNFLEFDDGTGHKTGLFLGHTFRQEAKVDSTLGAYLNKPEGSKLYEIPMLVGSQELADKITDEKRELLRSSRKENDLLKEIMYFPKNPDEIFMNSNGNLFPLEAIREQINFLKNNNITGQYVWLYKDLDGTVKHRYAEPHQKPISEYPVSNGTNKEAPFQIWEMPISNPPYGLYVAGADPYNQSSSQWSDSLGVCTIYKRMLDIASNEYVDMIVAQYAARPRTMEEWHSNVFLLLKYYNAICFPENEAGTFIQYFDNLQESNMLADGLDFLKEFNPNTKTIGRIKGAAATPKNIDYMMAHMYEYYNEEITIGQDEYGNPIKRLGVSRIPDIMLLEESLAYRPTMNGVKGTNSDRIVSFRHALAYAKFLDKYMPVVELNPKEEENKKEHSIKSPFITGLNSPFGVNRNPFR